MLRVIQIRPTETLVDSKIETENQRSLSMGIAQLTTSQGCVRVRTSASAATI